MTFYDPGEKLKKKRLTGTVVGFTNSGCGARVSLLQSKRTVVVDCRLTLEHGKLSKVRCVPYPCNGSDFYFVILEF